MEHKISLEIYGSSYPITTTEDPQYVLGLGEEIHESVSNIMGPDGTSATLPQALVLTALGYIDAYKKAEQASDHLRDQVAEYLEEAAKARKELTTARIQLERLSHDHQLKIEET